MEQRLLNRTELTVSRVCFGTMTFGNPVDQAGATDMVTRCMAAGINFFDTANSYRQGEAETILGRALKGRRHDVVLATKVCNKMGDGPDEQGLSRPAILRQIDESLKRLGTDYVDIYYMHRPDYAVPVEASLETMDSLVRAGKVRAIGASNYAAWQTCEMFWIAEKNGWQAPVIGQPMYNLVARGIEQEYLPMSKRLGVSNIVYNPLAGGLLTGKHDLNSFTSGGRFDASLWGNLYQDRYWHPKTFAAVDELKKVAAEAGRSLPSLAFNWLLHHSPADGLLLGASRMEQLEQNLALLAEGPLPADVVAACDAVWRELRGPSPVYNR